MPGVPETSAVFGSPGVSTLVAPVACAGVVLAPGLSADVLPGLSPDVLPGLSPVRVRGRRAGRGPGAGVGRLCSVSGS
ncbi:hypothetical protein, partial [Streptomyces sp. SID11385]|uniref:hypothetical protein n=1 Tax=Streptomyces sp. SID11385 TaxID=2706031 RepID=UPI0019445795